MPVPNKSIFCKSKSPVLLAAAIMLAVLAGPGFCQGSTAVDDSRQALDAKIVEGPLARQREILQEQIKLAAERGIGIGPYMNAFTALEAQVAAGATEEQIEARLGSIARGLDDQFKRSEILKTQKLPPPVAASSPQDGGLEQRARAAIQGKDPDLLNALKDKWFGGDMPDSIKSKIPPNFDPSQLSKEDAERLLKKLK